MSVRHALIPCLRYADAPAAIAFLRDAFGFVPQAVSPIPTIRRSSTTPSCCLTAT